MWRPKTNNEESCRQWIFFFFLFLGSEESPLLTGMIDTFFSRAQPSKMWIRIRKIIRLGPSVRRSAFRFYFSLNNWNNYELKSAEFQEFKTDEEFESLEYFFGRKKEDEERREESWRRRRKGGAITKKKKQKKISATFIT